MENEVGKKGKKARPGAVLVTFILCFLFWMCLTLSLSPTELIVGALVSFVVALVTARIFVHNKPFYFFNPRRLGTLLYYWFVVLFGEIVKANWDMAKRVLNPKLPTNPGFIRVEADVESEYGLAFLCNAITLTPGTITVDAAESEGKTYLYIHWIDVTTTERTEAGEIIKGRLQKWIRRI